MGVHWSSVKVSKAVSLMDEDDEGVNWDLVRSTTVILFWACDLDASEAMWNVFLLSLWWINERKIRYSLKRS